MEQGITCRMCNVQIASPQEIDLHYSGKKHRKRQFQESRKVQQEEKGIYVNQLGNLKLSSAQAYFSQFGTITNIFIGWDKAVEDKMYSLLIDFENEDSVQKILSRDYRNRHWVPVIPGEKRLHRVRVTPRRVNTTRPRSPSPPPPPQISFGEIQVCLSVQTDMDEQIREIMHLTELSEEDINERNSICKNISKVFSLNGYPDCVVSPFGSTVNGLGFRGCDVDIYLYLGAHWSEHKPNPLMQGINSENLPQAPVDFTKDNPDQFDQNDKSIQDQGNGSSSADDSSSVTHTGHKKTESLTQAEKVRIAAKLLRQIPHCSKIHPITGARVPIVKFIHSRTGINCDISFKNRASVLNSEYIRFCTEIDVRVRPLMMAIRLIFKRYEVAGGGGGAKISNYALTMLIIVYLQQLEKPLLHPVHVLQQFIEGEHELVEGWNFSICSDLTKLPQLPVNKQGLFELLTGFFKFFSELDLNSKFLSPFLGRVIDRDELKNEFPSEFEGRPPFLGPDGLHIDKFICLQDPFELTFNVCRNLPERGYRTLVLLFTQVYKACIQLKESPCPGGFNKLLGLEISPDNDIDLPDPIQVFGNSKVFLAFMLPDVSVATIQKNLATFGYLETQETTKAVSDQMEIVKDDVEEKIEPSNTKVDIEQKNDESKADHNEPTESTESKDDLIDEEKLKSLEQLVSLIFSKCLHFNTESEYEEKKKNALGYDPKTNQDELKRKIENATNQPEEKRTKLDEGVADTQTHNITTHLKDNEKNPVMCLYELLPKITFDCDEIGTNPDHSKKFRTSTVVDGQTFEGFGTSKKLSKAACAREVLHKKYAHNLIPEIGVAEKTAGEETAEEKTAEEKIAGDTEIPDSRFCKDQNWVVYHHVWNGRKRAHMEVSTSETELSVLEKELKITEELEAEYSHNFTLPPDITFKHHLKQYKGHVCLGLEVVHSRKKIFENLFTWLRSYLPDLLKKL